MRLLQYLGTISLAAVLCACSGGGGERQSNAVYAGLSSQPESCSLADQQAWLLAWMKDWYFWYQDIPSSPGAVDPQIEPIAAMRAHFTTLLFKGTQVRPADRWSFVEASDRYQQYYEEGINIGFGLSVAGQPDDPLPLRVRWVEPMSAAGLAGIKRGDIVVSIQGKPAKYWKDANDFSALAAHAVGDRLAIELEGSAGLRSLNLIATTYPISSIALPPDDAAPLVVSGRRVAYLFLKDFIEPSTPALRLALDDLVAGGVRDLILDLRYHGGGRVDVATRLASAIAPASLRSEVFSQLIYNDKHSRANTNERFVDPSPLPSMQLERVVVLTGSRTCSASEMLIHGLKNRHPSLDFVSIGSRTCGKPYGFHPVGACGLSYHAVNFEVRNDKGMPSDIAGIEPTCYASDDYQSVLGSASDPMIGAALKWLSEGECVLDRAAMRAQSLGVGSEGQPIGRSSKLIEDGDAPKAIIQ